MAARNTDRYPQNSENAAPAFRSKTVRIVLSSCCCGESGKKRVWSASWTVLDEIPDSPYNALTRMLEKRAWVRR